MQRAGNTLIDVTVVENQALRLEFRRYLSYFGRFQVLPVWMAILLFPLVEITVFQLAMVDSPRFAFVRQHTYRFSIKTSGGFLPRAQQMCVKIEARHNG